MVAICGDHPFFSTSDWFIGTTDMPGGIPQWVRDHVLKFHYNDIGSVREMFSTHPGKISCVILEAARIDEPANNFLQDLQKLCREQGALLVFDEMITGFRWHLNGAQGAYGVVPDLSTWGKGDGQRLRLSALAGRREVMELGGYEHSRERCSCFRPRTARKRMRIAAGIATAKCYKELGVIETL